MRLQAEQKLKLVRAILLDPFHAYPGLTIREREAATLASRGIGGDTIGKILGTGRRNGYRILEMAAAKIAEQDNRKAFTWTDLPVMMYEMLAEAVK